MDKTTRPLMTGLFPDRASAERGYSALAERGYSLQRATSSTSQRCRRRTELACAPTRCADR